MKASRKPPASDQDLGKMLREAIGDRGQEKEPAKEPPFGAVDLRPKPRADGSLRSRYWVFTLGGLHTTIDGEVLDLAGSPIGGLYAAGRTTSGIQAWGYISGTSLGEGTFFGRRAGRSVARQA